MRHQTLLVALATLFCLAAPSFAATGTINASPATVVIPVGSSVGTTTIEWNGSGASAFHVTVQCGGGNESLFASSGAGTYSQSAPWIQVGSSCTFRLRASTTTGTVLASVPVIGVGPSGSISASPQTVIIPAGASVGTSTLQWTGSYASAFHVTVQCGGGNESLFASSSPGTYSQAAPWITVGSSCIFRLRAETSSGPELARVTVSGVAGTTPTGSISAAPTTVVIPPGQASGSTTLSWTTSGVSQAFVLVSCNGGAQATLTSGGPGAGTYVTSLSVGSSCTYQLRANQVGGTLLGSVTVVGQQGQAGSGTLKATPPHVPVKKQATYGTAFLRWTSSLSSVELRRVESTGSETTLGTFAGNGSTSVSTIEAGRSYSFRLYGGGQLLASSATVQGIRLLTTERGGSNHVYFHNPPPVGGATYNGENYNYGILLHYHEAGVRPLVQSQLKEMFDNGQRSMRVLVHFLHSPGGTITTTPAESSRKCRVEAKTCPAGSEYFLPLQFQQNLATYLADIRDAGFERLLVGLGPQWINDFFACNDSQVPVSLRSQLYAGSPLVNELFEEAWGVAKEVRAITAQSGLPYLIDLGNEYVPPSNLADHGQCVKDIIEGTPQFTGYLKFLWNRYVQAYGAQDSVAFSVIVGNSWDADNRLARMPQFFSPMPPVLSLHSYSGHGDLGQAFDRARVVSDTMGRRPWVIGETNNRSTISSAALAAFLQGNPQQEIRYVLQWPGFNCTTEQQCLPLDFTAFSALGL